MQTILILGRQPAIGLAELESLYGSENVRAVGSRTAAVVEGEVDFARLGGCVKAAKLIQTLQTTSWKEIQNFLEKNFSQLFDCPKNGKLKLGLSAYGFDVSPQRINATGLNLKKTLRASGRSVRLVPNNQLNLDSAQVLHNKLTGVLGREILIIKNENKTIIAQTTAEQDIDEYALRDRGRPKRDARVGMLPPKLAQILVNLAIGKAGSQESRVKSQEETILDPFCGTGVVLQEALLMGCDVIGNDLEPRMVEYSRDNLDWLDQKIPYQSKLLGLEAGDATSHTWDQPFSAVASELYLGIPMTTQPSPEIMEKNKRNCDLILRKFLKNIHSQIKPGTRLCLAVPAWSVPQNLNFIRLPTLDSLETIGYNQVKFAHASQSELLYHRDGQIVGRELVVLTRK